jgi:hypothetical protein
VDLGRGVDVLADYGGRGVLLDQLRQLSAFLELHIVEVRSMHCVLPSFVPTVAGGH